MAAKKVSRWIVDGSNTLFVSEEAIYLAQQRGVIKAALDEIAEAKGNLLLALTEGDLGETVRQFRSDLTAHAEKTFTVEKGSTGAVKVTRYKAKDGELFADQEVADKYEELVMPHVKALKKSAGTILKGIAPDSGLSADSLVEQLLDGPLGESMRAVYEARGSVEAAKKAAEEAADEAEQQRKAEAKKKAKAAREAVTEDPDDNDD